MSGTFAEVGPVYHAAGANVIPIVRGNKKPSIKWGHWQSNRQTKEEIARLASEFPQADVAIILGAGSGNLVDIESDSAEGEESLRALGLPVPNTAMWSSSRGSHRLYRSREPLPTKCGLRPGAGHSGASALRGRATIRWT